MTMVKSNKLMIGASLLGLVILAWTGALIAFLLLKPTLAQWTLIVTTAAIVTEIAMWIGVALLGLTALNRFRIWARLRGTRR
jgi:Sec-independent protein secretion pathway component TatC